MKYRILFLTPLVLFASGVFPMKSGPNIAIILTSNLGWNNIACSGNQYTETPNIKALVIRFNKISLRFYKSTPKGTQELVNNNHSYSYLPFIYQ